MELDVYRSGKSWSGQGQSTLDDEQQMRACPFCGSRAVECGNTHTPHYWVECQDCGAQGPPSDVPEARNRIRSKLHAEALHMKAFADAVERWNQRPTTKGR